MVEILLAIGVLAIGFSAVLGIFPVAIKMVRNSQTESLVADAVGDLQSYYYSMANIPLIDTSSTLTPKPQLNGEYWYALLFYPMSADTSLLPISGAPSYPVKFFVNDKGATSILEIDTARTEAKSGSTSLHGPTFLEALKEEIGKSDYTIDKLTSNADFGLIKSLNLFRPALSGSLADYQTFYLIGGEDDFHRITSTAQLLVWLSPFNKFYKTNDALVNIDYKYGVVLNIEASWPINVPYDDREKRFYQFIIANPKKLN